MGRPLPAGSRLSGCDTQGTLTAMTQRKSPTVKRRRVAATLRSLRTNTGLTLEEAGRRVAHDGTWLSRIEKAENGIHVNDLRPLLELYGITGEEAQAVIEINQGARTRGWWQPYKKDIPDWFSDYVGMESEATFIRTYEAQVVPGILQTERYARAVLEASPKPPTAAEIERLVKLRMERHATLTDNDSPQLRAIIDEGALRRIVGSGEVMREQIDHLLSMSKLNKVDLLVLPFEAGAHAGLDGPFVLFEFEAAPKGYPDTVEPRVVFIDYLAGAYYMEEPPELAVYNAAWDRLAGLADTPANSRRRLRTIAESLETHQ
jgi:transcriptional regulator with XRE-family HTH domain